MLSDFNADQLSNSDDASSIYDFTRNNILISVLFGASCSRREVTLNTWLDSSLINEHAGLLLYWKTDSSFINSYDIITTTLDSSVLQN